MAIYTTRNIIELDAYSAMRNIIELDAYIFKYVFKYIEHNYVPGPSTMGTGVTSNANASAEKRPFLTKYW